MFIVNLEQHMIKCTTIFWV